MDYIYNFAEELIEKASKLIIKSFKNISKISYKKGYFNLVTNVDHEVEALIIKEINLKFPDHSIIAEESGLQNKNPKHQWFIDPIDGTTNFAHRYPCFCISLAYAKNNKLIFGLVKNPLTGEIYSAKKNKGARLNGKQITVSRIKKLKNSLLATGFPYEKKSSRYSNFNNFCRLTMSSHGVRRDGSAALDLCYVASGKIDGFWEFKLSPWDVAAGILIVKEAGGKITDIKGNKYNFNSQGIVASNDYIHKEFIRLLK